MKPAQYIVRSIPPASSKPVVEVFPHDTTSVEGSTTLFPIQVSGVPSPSITWYHNNTQLENDYAHKISANGSLIITTTEMRHGGEYRVVASNSTGSVEKKLHLTVYVEEIDEPQQSVHARAEIVPIPVAKFGEYVTHNHGNSNNGFIEMFEVS